MTNIDNQLVTKQDHIMAQFSDVLEGVGKFPGKPYKIGLNPKIPPKQMPCRPVPVHLKHTFKAEIDKMLKAGVLKPVQEATPGSIVLYWWKGLTNMVNTSSTYALTPQI